MIPPHVGPTALAILVKLAWSETNRRSHMRVYLVDDDGHQVQQQGPDGLVDVEARADFEAGRPPGVKQGAEVTMPLAVPIPPLQLLPDRRYEWCLEVDGKRVTTSAFRTWNIGATP